MRQSRFNHSIRGKTGWWFYRIVDEGEEADRHRCYDAIVCQATVIDRDLFELAEPYQLKPLCGLAGDMALRFPVFGNDAVAHLRPADGGIASVEWHGPAGHATFRVAPYALGLEQFRAQYSFTPTASLRISKLPRTSCSNAQAVFPCRRPFFWPQTWRGVEAKS